MNPKTQSWQACGICVLLVLMVFAVFGQTARFDFVGYDDQLYVFQNPTVEKGLSIKAVGWAFTHSQVSNWIPLTTLSHMLDCQVFGLRPGWHHFVNVMWHAASTVLLFLVLRAMTGSIWRSAFVAALFGVHPLRAESVAWVSERKDVISGFFFILAIGAYVRQVRKPSWAGYTAVVLLFTLGLLAKSMVATLPFVLLLLDYWPLGRLRNQRDFAVLVREKIPLFAISAIFCVVTSLMPGLIVPYRRPFLQRAGNALVSYVIYLRQLLLPLKLAPNYPLTPNGQALWKAGLAILILSAISAGVVVWRKKHPSLLMGWLWYLGMLFPVIGIIQISSDAAHADRYTYLPEIGLTFAAIWTLADWMARWKLQRGVLGSLAVAVIGALILSAYNQTSFWRNDELLWSRALACNPATNPGEDFYSVAHNGLGNALSKGGKKDQAIAQYRMALQINPGYKVAHYNLGIALMDKGQKEEAIEQYQIALKLDPEYAEAHNNLGVALSAVGQVGQAKVQYQTALKIDPDYAEARYNLGNNLLQSGKLEESIGEYRTALEITPGDTRILNNLGIALNIKGEYDGAIAQFRKALAINPDFVDANYNLGVSFLKIGKPDDAIHQYRKALEINPRYTKARIALALARNAPAH